MFDLPNILGCFYCKDCTNFCFDLFSHKMIMRSAKGQRASNVFDCSCY